MSRIGLALGAGGFGGRAFHAGVLSALEEGTGWDPRSAEVVVGTSAGSQIGTALRIGLSAGDLAARIAGNRASPEGERIFERLGPPPDLAPGWRDLVRRPPVGLGRRPGHVVPARGEALGPGVLAGVPAGPRRGLAGAPTVDLRGPSG